MLLHSNVCSHVVKKHIYYNILTHSIVFLKLAASICISVENYTAMNLSVYLEYDGVCPNSIN